MSDDFSVIFKKHFPSISRTLIQYKGSIETVQKLSMLLSLEFFGEEKISFSVISPHEKEMFKDILQEGIFPLVLIFPNGNARVCLLDKNINDEKILTENFQKELSNALLQCVRYRNNLKNLLAFFPIVNSGMSVQELILEELLEGLVETIKKENKKGIYKTYEMFYKFLPDNNQTKEFIKNLGITIPSL
jgi:hypothetical protein